MLAALALALTTAAAAPHLGGCPAFSRADAWNRDVSRAGRDPRSDAYVASVGAGLNLHPDFGSGRLGDFGIPINVVARSQARVPVHFTAYGAESDKGPYPTPPGARVEAGSDKHVLVVRRGECKLYELFDAHRDGKGWAAGSGAVFDLRHGTRRPKGWTSADAAGLPIAVGLARPDEASRGVIRHALRFTAPRTQNRYVPPARHFASSDSDPALPPMGQRFRLKRAFALKGYRGQSLAILRALKRYGLILADNGAPWFISGAADPGWHDADLEQLKRVPASAFEAVRP